MTIIVYIWMALATLALAYIVYMIHDMNTSMDKHFVDPLPNVFQADPMEQTQDIKMDQCVAEPLGEFIDGQGGCLGSKTMVDHTNGITYTLDTNTWSLRAQTNDGRAVLYSKDDLVRLLGTLGIIRPASNAPSTPAYLDITAVK